MKKLMLTLMLVAVMAQPAFAGTDYNLCFGKIDSDYDDEMTMQEFKAAFPNGDEAVFKTADADKNSTVSHDEWEDFKASQGFEEGDHHDG